MLAICVALLFCSLVYLHLLAFIFGFLICAGLHAAPPEGLTGVLLNSPCHFFFSPNLFCLHELILHQVSIALLVRMYLFICVTTAWQPPLPCECSCYPFAPLASWPEPRSSSPHHRIGSICIRLLASTVSLRACGSLSIVSACFSYFFYCSLHFPRSLCMCVFVLCVCVCLFSGYMCIAIFLPIYGFECLLIEHTHTPCMLNMMPETTYM
jgi:hypothetical protein